MGRKLPNLAQSCPTYPKVAQPQSKIYNFDIQMILCKKNEDFIVIFFLDYCIAKMTYFHIYPKMNLNHIFKPKLLETCHISI